MSVNKVIYGGSTLIDLSGDSLVSADQLLKGVSAHNAAGQLLVGTLEQLELFAIIAVTYPEGSVCTCYDSTTKLTARDTSGRALFNVPIGEWTVSCTNGSNSKSTTVSITAKGQSVSVELSYARYLFKSGSGFQNGYSTSNDGIGGAEGGPAASNNTRITIASSNNQSKAFYFTPNTDLTKYTKLYFDAHITSRYSAYNKNALFGLGTNKHMTIEDGGGYSFPGGLVQQPVGDRSTKCLDISKLSGTGWYIKVMSNLTTGYLYNCWLEE